jgi:FtsH-binding integral membrane protein
MGAFDVKSFLTKVYGLTGLGFALTGLSALALASVPYTLPGALLSLVICLALMFAAFATRGVISAGFFLAFSLVEGYGLGPFLAHHMHVAPLAVPLAFVTTAVLFVGLSAYVIFTKKDFSFMGAGLFIALIVLIGAIILSLFFPFLTVLVSAAVAVVFSMYILYDTSEMIHGRYEDDQYGSAAVAIYLDILNLFLSLVRLFSALTDD